jgi:hypothetical protein
MNDNTHVEWACQWLPEADGHAPLTPARDEAWARKHARQWGTTPVSRTVGPWTPAPTSWTCPDCEQPQPWDEDECLACLSRDQPTLPPPTGETP